MFGDGEQYMVGKNGGFILIVVSAEIIMFAIEKDSCSFFLTARNNRIKSLLAFENGLTI